MRRRFALWLALALWPLAAGCGAGSSILADFQAPPGVSSHSSPELAGRPPLRRIAVLPFRNESGVLGAGKQIADIFYDELSSSQRYDVLPPPEIDKDEELRFEFRLRGGRGEGVRNQVLDEAWLKQKLDRFVAAVQPYLTNQDLIYPGEYFEGHLKETENPKDRGLVAEANEPGGGSPDLDGVLTGVITRYENRSGGALIGDKGPHVTYSVYLLDPKNGKILWEATFNEEQIPLLNNLLLLPRYAEAGFIWQTNDMLARNGLKRVLKDFPGWQAGPATAAAP